MKFSKKKWFLIFLICLLTVTVTSLRVKDMRPEGDVNEQISKMTDSEKENIVKLANNIKENNKINVKLNDNIITKAGMNNQDNNKEINPNNLLSNYQEITIQEKKDTLKGGFFPNIFSGDPTISDLFVDDNHVEHDCDCDTDLFKIYKREKQASKKTSIVIIQNIKITIPYFKRYFFIEKDFGIALKRGYLFDYLESVFQIDIVTEFMSIFYNLLRIEYDIDDDPYEENYLRTGYKKKYKIEDGMKDENTEVKITTTLEIDRSETFEIRDRNLYSISITVPQVKYAFQNWNWYYMKELGVANAKDFVDLYDLNGDGRLSAYELLTGVIFENSDNPNCRYCFKEISKKLEIIYKYTQCKSTNYINSSRMAFKFKFLKRVKIDRYNIFKCKNYKYHEEIMEDFVIKLIKIQNDYYHYAKGLIKRENFLAEEYKSLAIDFTNFKMGILFGFLTRQVSPKGKIYINESIRSQFTRDTYWSKYESKSWFSMSFDERSKKHERWEDDGYTMKDCNDKDDKVTKDCYGRIILQ